MLRTLHEKAGISDVRNVIKFVISLNIESNEKLIASLKSG